MFVSRHPWSLSGRAAVNHGQSGVATTLQFSTVDAHLAAGRLQLQQFEFGGAGWELQDQQVVRRFRAEPQAAGRQKRRHVAMQIRD